MRLNGVLIGLRVVKDPGRKLVLTDICAKGGVGGSSLFGNMVMKHQVTFLVVGEWRYGQSDRIKNNYTNSHARDMIDNAAYPYL